MTGRRLAWALAAALGLGLGVPTGADATAPAAPATSVGYDISFPQCGHPYPRSPGFGVVGVNKGHDFSLNPCLESEFRWTGHAATTAPAFYLNTGAPGPGDAHWPRRQAQPRPCHGANSTTCAYDYGWNSARQSFASVLGVLLRRGTPKPRVTAATARWWLDVEVGNPWETWLGRWGRTRHSELVDQSSVLGELGYLRSQSVAFVGVYSSAPMWRSLMGAVGQTFSSVPAWIPGSASLTDAVANCATRSFTGGFVAMLQYPSSGFDGDYQCPLATASATASLTVLASAGYHRQLSVDGVGPVAYAQTAGTPALVVSPAGLVTTSGSLARGTYRATGTTTDTAGDAGTFSVTLSVGAISQVDPTTGAVTVPGSPEFSAQLSVAGAVAPVTFVQSTGQPALAVSPAGLVATSGPLAPGLYSATGTTGDTSGDAGTFHFTLTVGLLVQQAPTSGSVASAQSSAFRKQLVVSGGVGPVSFLQGTGQPDLVVSPTGLVSASGPLAAGAYSASGTTSDGSGDVGVFSFQLAVTASPPTTTTTTTPPPPTTTTTSALAAPASGATSHARHPWRHPT